MAQPVKNVIVVNCQGEWYPSWIMRVRFGACTLGRRIPFVTSRRCLESYECVEVEMVVNEGESPDEVQSTCVSANKVLLSRLDENCRKVRPWKKRGEEMETQSSLVADR